MKWVKIVPSLLLVAACANPEIANSWKGANADDLVMTWGAPDRISPMPNGGRELRYVFREDVMLYQNFGAYGGGTASGMAATSACKVAFLTDQENAIVRVNIEGDDRGCARLLDNKTQRGK